MTVRTLMRNQSDLKFNWFIFQINIVSTCHDMNGLKICEAPGGSDLVHVKPSCKYAICARRPFHIDRHHHDQLKLRRKYILYWPQATPCPTTRGHLWSNWTRWIKKKDITDLIHQSFEFWASIEFNFVDANQTKGVNDYCFSLQIVNTNIIIYS